MGISKGGSLVFVRERQLEGGYPYPNTAGMVHHDSTTAVSPTPSSSRDSVAGVKRERADIEVTTGSPAGSANGGGGGGPESKKRKAAPGSRGVANLTPEQLAKKRANGMYMLYCRPFLLPFLFSPFFFFFFPLGGSKLIPKLCVIVLPHRP